MFQRIIQILKTKEINVSGYDPDKVRDWLAKVYETATNGFMHYYILRERQLKDELSSGLEGKDYWVAYGRLQELKRLQSQSKITYENLNK
jgi:hypothetical protein